MVSLVFITHCARARLFSQILSEDISRYPRIKKEMTLKNIGTLNLLHSQIKKYINHINGVYYLRKKFFGKREERV